MALPIFIMPKKRRKYPKWQKGLTKEERDHIKEWGGRTLERFKRNRESQKQFQTETEPCWTCRRIAQKVGLEK